MMPKCTFAGCNREIKSRGYCAGHYQQLKAGKELQPLRHFARRGQYKEYRCSFSGCDREASVGGLCDGHYQQKRAGKKLEPLRVVRHGCSVAGCTKPHEAHGYCRKHYDKWRSHGDAEALTNRDPLAPEDRGDHLAVPLGGKNGKGLVALISHSDRERIEDIRWWATGEKNPTERYAACKIDGLRVTMHRLLLGLSRDDPRQGDHENGNRLDNRRENLRIVTFPEQMQNKKPWGKSGHRNCFWEEKKQLWRVIVTKSGKRHSGGRHKNIDDAIEAARLLREKLFSHANEGRVALEAG